MSFLEEYFRLQKHYTDKYGDRTLLFMEVGTFYCLYSIDEDTLTADISNLIGARLTLRDTTKKDEGGTIRNPYMVGFPTAAYSKYHQTFMLNNYTVVIYDQSPNDSTVRNLRDVKSPSTSTVQQNGTVTGHTCNKIFAVYIECLDNKIKMEDITLLVGISNINIVSGKTEVKELYTSKIDCRYVINELYRILSANKPKELQITINYLDSSINHSDFEKYLTESLELDSFPILILKSSVNKEYLNSAYQEQFLSKVFRPTLINELLSGTVKIQLNKGAIIDIFTELNLEKFKYAVVSYIILLQYCYEHDEMLIANIKKPTVLSEDDHTLNLTYNAAIQLNLIPANINRVNYRVNKKKTPSNVLSILDFTRTSMGKRALQERLLNPIIDEDILQSRYNTIEELRHQGTYIRNATGLLAQLYDLEKLDLKLIKGTLMPRDFCNLMDSCKTIIELINLSIPLIITADKKPTSLYSIFPRNSEIANFNKMLAEIYNTFDLEILIECNLAEKQMHCKKSPLRPGHSQLSDQHNAIILQNEARLNEICEHLDRLIGVVNTIKIDSATRKVKKGKSVDDDEDEEIINTKDLGIYLPPGRAEKVKRYSSNVDVQLCGMIRLEAKNKRYAVRSEYIDYYCDKIIAARSAISDELYNFYTNFIHKMSTTYNLKSIIQFVIELDLAISGAICSLKYNYHKPEIIPFKESQKSFIVATELRHPLVEQIISTEYISNDISLGDTHQGIVLYACNSAGKTVLATSIPLAVVMAQCGLWVAGKIKFTPYKRIITRLSGNDDVLKGHSSFVVEMLELRTILNNADVRSLIIGDELCRGTETLSAVAITTSAIDFIINRRSSFIFSTHLHELTNKDPLLTYKTSGALKVCHLTIRWQPEIGTLVYDRKIKDGPGDTVYGLEVAKSLDMNSDFLNLAQRIRKDLQGDSQEFLNFKTSKYNRQVRVDSCVFCGTKVNLQTHHIREQSKADSNGFIGDVHKNDEHNLLVLCKGCHTDIHNKKITILTEQTPDGVVLSLS